MIRDLWVYSPGDSLDGVDEGRCRYAVTSGFRHRQCDKKAKLFEKVKGHEEPLGFCKQHAPSTRKARSDAREKVWVEKHQARELERKRTSARGALVSAVLALPECDVPKAILAAWKAAKEFK